MIDGQMNGCVFALILNKVHPAIFVFKINVKYTIYIDKQMLTLASAYAVHTWYLAISDIGALVYWGIGPLKNKLGENE